MKFGSPEYELTDIEQLGYKLILNSASGILDASFDTKLRANNKAMAMRCIGQLFTYRIAAALAIEGASVPSSNTDGIYVFNIPLDKNTEIVDRELKKLYVSIDPEPLYLVSKDANNRLEMVNGQVTSARGGTLTSWSGARVDNRLSHPALVDKVMTRYLQLSDLKGAVDQKAVIQALREYITNPTIIDEFKDFPDALKRTVVYMTSWVMRSTSGSIFLDTDNVIHPGTTRVWLARTGVQFERYVTVKRRPSKSYNEFAKQLPSSSLMGDPEVLATLSNLPSTDGKASALMQYFGDADTVSKYREIANETGVSSRIVAKAKISSLPASAHLYINNHSILKMSAAEIDKIYRRLDWESYAKMIASFAEVWQNPLKIS